MNTLATTLVTVLTVLATACTLTTDLDGLASGAAADADDDDATHAASTSGSSSGTKPSSSGSSSSGSSSSGSSSSGSSSSGSTGSTSSTTSSSSSGQSPSNVVLRETFPDEGACTGWVPEAGSTRQFRADLGHDGAGACEVCGTGGDFFLTKTITVPKSGLLSASMFVRRGDGADVTKATFGLVTPSGSVSSSKNVGEEFTSFTSGSSTVAGGASVTVKLGLKDGTAGQCLVFDDVQVTVN